jgi:hypothetical protein
LNPTQDYRERLSMQSLELNITAKLIVPYCSSSNQP